MKKRGYSAIGLINPKNNINVGSVLRAAGCFGVSAVFYSGKRYSKAPTDAMGTVKHIPLIRMNSVMSSIPYGCVPVAVDLIEGATNIHDYEHPERAIYIFGPEDGTLGRNTTDLCRDIIYIPTNRCLNLAACVNVVLYDRSLKRKEHYGQTTERDSKTNSALGGYGIREGSV